MKLKDLRKTLMNAMIDKLRTGGILTSRELWVLMPSCEPVGFGTAQHTYCTLLMELCDAKLVTSYGAGCKRPTTHATYQLHDRMYDDRGTYIGNTLFDPEWPN